MGSSIAWFSRKWVERPVRPVFPDYLFLWLWQNTYPNFKTTCHIKLKFFLWTKLLENLPLSKYLVSVAAPLIYIQYFFNSDHIYCNFFILHFVSNSVKYPRQSSRVELSQTFDLALLVCLSLSIHLQFTYEHSDASLYITMI